MILFLLSIFCCFISADFGAGVLLGYNSVTKYQAIESLNYLIINKNEINDSSIFIGGNLFYLKDFKNFYIGSNVSICALSNRHKSANNDLGRLEISSTNPYGDIFLNMGIKHENYRMYFGLGAYTTKVKSKFIFSDNKESPGKPLSFIDASFKIGMSYDYKSKIGVDCSVVLVKAKDKVIKPEINKTIHVGKKTYSDISYKFKPVLSRLQLCVYYKIK